MSRFTPSLNAAGIYTLRDPFPDIASKVYRCVAIRSFKDYLDLGQSAFDTVYAPAGLSQAVFDADAAEKANIVTLVSTGAPTILVPDTYITKYPDLEYVAYSSLVVSAALGPLPDEMNLDLLKQQIAGTISDVVGVEPIVRVHATGASGVISYAQHVTLETTRAAAISNRVSDRARLLEAQARIATLEQKIRDLEDAVIAQP